MFVQVIVSSRCTEFGYSHNAAAGDDEFLSFLVVLATTARPPSVLKEPPRTNTSGYSHRWVGFIMATIIKGALCGFGEENLSRRGRSSLTDLFLCRNQLT